MATALIIVDVQNDFCEGGSLAVAAGNAVAEAIVLYLEDDAAYDYIVTTQDWHIDPGDHFSETPDYVSTWPAHCWAHTTGADLHEAISRVEAHERFLKGLYSAAYSGFEGVADGAGDLHSWLQDRGVTEVDICGIATDYCVKATALDAARLGYATMVLSPLTAAVSPGGERAAVDEMRAAGVKVN